MGYLSSKEFEIEKVENNEYLLSFKEETVNEIEDIAFIQILGDKFEKDEIFLEVESNKATFEYALPFDFEVVEDYTDDILNLEKISTNTKIAKIKKAN